MLAFEKSAEASFPGKNSFIAFTLFPEVGPDSEIYKVLPDGSGLKQVTHNTTGDQNPAWSADGTKIAFASYRDRHDSEIYVKDTTKGRVTQITDNFETPEGEEADDFSPVWSPDGTKIAFARELDGVFSRCPAVFVMDADGSDEKQLTNGCNHPNAWSPDGSKIAYSKCFEECDIWVTNLDGTDQRSLTQLGAPSGASSANWKPNGRKIVYGQDSEIWKMNPDGSGKHRLTFSPPYAGAPLWSPNGRKIIFTESDGEGGEHVVKMDVDGSNRTNVYVRDLPVGSDTGITGDADWQPIPTP